MISLIGRIKCFFVDTDNKMKLENVLGFLAVLTYSLTYISASIVNEFTLVNLLILVYKSMFIISLLTLIKKRAVALIELSVALIAIGTAQVISGSISIEQAVSSIGVEVAVLMIGIIMSVVSISHNNKEISKKAENVTLVKKLISLALMDLSIERPRKTTRFIWIGLVIIGVTGFYISEISMNNSIPFVTAVWTIVPIFSILLTTFGYIEAFVMRFVESLLTVYVLVLQLMVSSVALSNILDTTILILVCVYCIAKSRMVIKNASNMKILEKGQLPLT